MGYSWGMELTQQQHEHLKDLLPRQRGGNVKGDNRRVLAAILDVVEQGCKAGPAGAFRQVAYDLYAHESLGEEWRAGPDIRGFTAAAAHPRAGRSGLAGEYHRASASGRDRRAKKTGRKPAGSLAAAGRPRFIWLPRMLARP